MVEGYTKNKWGRKETRNQRGKVGEKLKYLLKKDDTTEKSI